MIKKALVGTMLSLFTTGIALAAISPEKSKMLDGPELTAFGAIRAGNDDGSIPEYKGEPIIPPASYVPGSGRYPDPFFNDQPLFTITADNMEEYADKLDEGTLGMLERWPETFQIPVYTTRRTAPYPAWVLENIKKHASTAELVNEAGDGVVGAYGGIPFPIPKNGLEVLWNHLLYWQPHVTEALAPGYLVDGSGNSHLMTVAESYSEVPYYDPESTELNGPYFKVRTLTKEPARVAGEQFLLHYTTNYTEGTDNTWSYSPGQRRVRLAPEFKYDTPSPGYGGAMYFDETYLFSGRPDRFDWKLVGRKEMYIPYNSFVQANTDPKELLGEHHLNPEYTRWELHRVWEVEATLKDGERHAAHKRKYYFDEDSWKLVLYSGFDKTGDLFRTGHSALIQIYDERSPFMHGAITIYDFSRKQYLVTPVFGREGYLRSAKRRPAFETTSSALSGSGLR